MKNSEKQILMSLEQKLIHSLSQYNDYDIDLTLDADDFSKEILFIKTLNDFDRYKRAFLQFDNKLENLDILEEQIYTKLGDIRSNEDQKFDQLTTKYFGEKRINMIFNDLEYNSFKNQERSTQIDDNIDQFQYVIKLMDNLNLASNSDLSMYHSVKDLFKTGSDAFDSLRKNNHFMLQYFSDHIINTSKALLIPDDELNKWWFQIQPLSESSLEHAFNVFYEKQNQNSFVADVIMEMSNESSKHLNEMKDVLKEGISWGRGRLKAFDDMLIGFMTNEQALPAYKTWSESEEKPISSDHAMPAVVLKRITSMNNEIVNDLIKLAKNPELELDQRKRNEIIATAYLMIGETQKAMDILDSE